MMGKVRRKYSDQQKSDALAALDANGGNVAMTSRQLKIPRKTLEEWSKERGINTDVAELRQQKVIDLATRLEIVAHQILDTLPTKLNEATAQQLATSLGILIDKAQLLNNKPTERHEVIGNLSVDERVNRINSLFERARDRRIGQPAADD